MGRSIYEFQGRDDLTKQKYRIKIDQKNDQIIWERCVRPNGFWNLFPKKLVECRCTEIWKVQTHSVQNLRMVTITLPAGTVGFSEDELDNFDDFVELIRSLENPAGCPEALKSEKPDYVAYGVMGLIALGLAGVVVGYFLNWF